MNFDILLACIGIFFGELYGNFVGGGSLVTQIFLQNIIGFEIKNAVALDNAAVLWSEIGLLTMLLRKQKIEKWMWYVVAVSSLWALFWANLLNTVPTEIMKIIFTLAVLWLVVKNLLFSSPVYIEKWFVVNRKNLILLCSASFFIATYNAFLSVWDFIIWLLVLTSIFHFKYHRALFILTFWFVFARAVWTAEYFRLGLIDINFYIPMLVSALFSGVIAWYFVEKIHSDTFTMLLKYLSIFLAWYLILQLIF